MLTIVHFLCNVYYIYRVVILYIPREYHLLIKISLKKTFLLLHLLYFILQKEMKNYVNYILTVMQHFIHFT